MNVEKKKTNKQKGGVNNNNSAHLWQQFLDLVQLEIIKRMPEIHQIKNL